MCSSDLLLAEAIGQQGRQGLAGGVGVEVGQGVDVQPVAAVGAGDDDRPVDVGDAGADGQAFAQEIFGYVLYQQQTRQLVGALNAAVNAGLHQSAGAVADDGYMDNTHAFKTFSVIVDPDGDIISSDGNENELAEVENWHDVVEKVISSNGTMGKLSKYDLMYKRVYDLNTGYSTIAFINNSQLNKYMFSLLTIAITLFCSLMVIMFVVSWFLFTLAIRPLNKAWNQQQ